MAAPALRASVTLAFFGRWIRCSASAARPAGKARSSDSPGFSRVKASEASARAKPPRIALSSLLAAGVAGLAASTRRAIRPVWLARASIWGDWNWMATGWDIELSEGPRGIGAQGFAQG